MLLHIPVPSDLPADRLLWGSRVTNNAHLPTGNPLWVVAVAVVVCLCGVGR